MKNNGFRRTIGSIVWLLILAGAVLAFFQVKEMGVEGLWDWAKVNSVKFKDAIHDCAINFPNCKVELPKADSTSQENDGTLLGKPKLNDKPLEVNKPKLIDVDTKNNNDNKQIEPINNETTTIEPDKNVGLPVNTTDKEDLNNIKSKIPSLEDFEATALSYKNAKNMLNRIKPLTETDVPRYKRTEWKHWDNVNDSTCWTVREEALYQQAEKGSVVLLDKEKQETTDKSQACSIKEGKWLDPYSDKIITNPTQADLDHTVPLAAAFRAGGYKWTKNAKEEFANDATHLVVTSRMQNRTKGDKTPSQWMPENIKAHCDYSKIYIATMFKYELGISNEDRVALDKGLATCQ